VTGNQPTPTIPAARAARLVALRLLGELGAARARLDAPDDPEALHDLRVALRRLRSLLRAYDAEIGDAVRRKTRRRLRRLARATGDARDLEVHLAWLRAQRADVRAAERMGVDWLIARLQARQEDALVAMRAAVARDADRVRATLAGRLATYTARVEVSADETWAATAARLAAAQLAELQARLAEVRTIDDQRPAHEARIAGKRLRYLLEPLRNARLPAEAGSDARDPAVAAVEELKALQDALGDMHDAHVFAAEVAAAEEELGAAGSAEPPRAPGEPPRPRRRGSNPAVGLQALRRRLRAREEREFEAVRERWLGDGAAALVAHVEGVVAALRLALDDREIERKYLLHALPREAGRARAAEIEQGYLPGERLVERVRRVRDGDGERFYRTVKLGAGVERTEVEEETTRDVFEALWRLTKGRRVRKRRHVVPDGDVAWEIDDFRDRRLVLAEVELPSADATVTFPPWLRELVVREVTDEGEYTNARLAK
jgi:CHAD domain-containing protein/CYTH domain-containing protein